MGTFTINTTQIQRQDLPTDSSANLSPTPTSISRIIRSLEDNTEATTSAKTNAALEASSRPPSKNLSQSQTILSLKGSSALKRGQTDQDKVKSAPRSSTIPISGLKHSKALWRMSVLCEYAAQARNDTPAGHVHDFYFDDKTWAIRYVAVDLSEWQRDTKAWVLGQKVVVPARACGYPRKKTKSLPLTLPIKQIEFSPNVQMYRALLKDLSLCNTKGVVGYQVQTPDGEIGQIKDFIIDTRSWLISLLVIDVQCWSPSRQIAVAPLWVNRVDVNNLTVHINFTKRFIQDRLLSQNKAV